MRLIALGMNHKAMLKDIILKNDALIQKANI